MQYFYDYCFLSTVIVIHNFYILWSTRTHCALHCRFIRFRANTLHTGGNMLSLPRMPINLQYMQFSLAIRQLVADQNQMRTEQI